MRIELYRVKEAPNVLNKTLEDGLTLPLRLKRDVNILYPVLTLREVDGVSLNGFNYCYIEELERYYFIDSLERIHAKIVRVSLIVDVIGTYREEVLNSSARYYRGIKTGDFYDGSLEKNLSPTSTIYKSDKSLEAGESLILTTLGV